MRHLTEDPVRSKEITENVSYRIQEQIDHFRGVLPERYAIAWGGYLAALWEKGMLTFDDYRSMGRLLPKIAAPDPIEDIFIFESAVLAVEAKLEGAS